MPTKKTLNTFLDELASSSPAPGGGSVAALSGALGAALTCMVCNLTIGKKKYAAVEDEMKKILAQAEEMRGVFTLLIDKDTAAFNKVMEAYSLPKDTDPQKALRAAAIREATKEATMVPLEVMKHCIDALALAQQVAASGNVNSVSDAGVSALMLYAAVESAALNVRINLNSLGDSEFVGWKSEELESLRNTGRMMLEEIQGIVADKLKND
ncbi:MAG TPA: cyclodeaminase/cyclohydrolase family protein [Bacteroidota bacterium]|nr:cyclodeaminase/cyclohydrolase family protein [Bacteroidota bacterium]